MKTAVLVMSCDARSFLWEGWWKSFSSKWDFNIESHIYFSSETNSPKAMDRINLLLTGKGSWSWCLQESLKQLPDEIDTVFLLLEDFWPTQTIPKAQFDTYFTRFKTAKMLALHCSPPCSFYRIVNGYFHPKSPYLMNYQPAFWNRSFLFDCLRSKEDPWQSELEGTKRLHKLDLVGGIGWEKVDWYIHACRRGKLTKEGKNYGSRFLPENPEREKAVRLRRGDRNLER